MQNNLPKYCKVARSQAEVDDAQRLRFQCIAEDLGIGVKLDSSVGREISSRDNLPTTHHLLLYCGSTLIGTARLALPNTRVAASSRTEFGFELEHEFELGGLSAVGEGLGEVARLVVLRPWRSTAAVLRLYEGLYCLSREVGVTHWVGAVDCQTCRGDEAELMRVALEARGLMDPRFGVTTTAAAGLEEIALETSFYSDMERARAKERPSELRIARTLDTFTRRLGARCLGRPARHPAFPRFVMPMLVDLHELPLSTLAHFDLSQLGPSLSRTPSFAPELHHGIPEEERIAS